MRAYLLSYTIHSRTPYIVPCCCYVLYRLVNIVSLPKVTKCYGLNISCSYCFPQRVSYSNTLKMTIILQSIGCRRDVVLGGKYTTVALETKSTMFCRWPGALSKISKTSFKKSPSPHNTSVSGIKGLKNQSSKTTITHAFELAICITRRDALGIFFMAWGGACLQDIQAMTLT